MQDLPKHLPALLIWVGLTGLCASALGLSALSPFLAWREPIYIAAGFAGIIAFCLMLFQPLLAAGRLPGPTPVVAKRLHRWLGLVLLGCVLVHVGGLWITSPPDVMDALVLASPTPFSVWGVLALWALLAAAALAAVRRRITRLVWRIGHSALVALVIAGTILHVLLIEGTMEPVSKGILCLTLVCIFLFTCYRLGAWRRISRRNT